jgi:hypothetical protein
VMFSIDGRGTVTRHFPLEKLESVRLEPKGEVSFPTSYQLDDAPGFERFILVTSPEALDARIVEIAVWGLVGKANGDTAPLDMGIGKGEDLEVDSFVVRKGGKGSP